VWICSHETLLVNSKTYEKVVLHMTFEGAKGQGRSPVKPARMALEIGRCYINQQSHMTQVLPQVSCSVPRLPSTRYTYCISRRNFFGSKQLWA
jgi:hypothetical protein